MATRRRSMASRPRRKRVWAREADTGSIGAGGATQFDVLSAFAALHGATTLGATVGRVRLSLGWETTSTPGALDSLVIGMRVGARTSDVTDQQPTDFLTGGSHLDWMLWRKLYPTLQSVNAAAAQTGDASWELDIRAMRRMEEVGETLWLVVDTALTPTLAGVASYGISTLLVLP